MAQSNEQQAAQLTSAAVDAESKYLSRKFILSALVILGCYPLLVFGKLDQETFRYMVLGSLTLYLSGNVIGNVSQVVQEVLSKKNA